MATATVDEYVFFTVPLLGWRVAFRWNRSWGWTFDDDPDRVRWFAIRRRPKATFFYLPLCSFALHIPKAKED